MPNKWTFQIPPIERFLKRWISSGDCVVDPFCGKSKIGIRNDIANGGLDAVDFLKDLETLCVIADVVVLDPPYSPRQMVESYRRTGREATQNARLRREAVLGLDKLLRPGGIALSFGWNSTGFGDGSYTTEEILLVNHGAAHNDTICLAQRKFLDESDWVVPKGE